MAYLHPGCVSNLVGCLARGCAASSLWRCFARDCAGWPLVVQVADPVSLTVVSTFLALLHVSLPLFPPSFALVPSAFPPFDALSNFLLRGRPPFPSSHWRRKPLGFQHSMASAWNNSAWSHTATKQVMDKTGSKFLRATVCKNIVVRPATGLYENELNEADDRRKGLNRGRQPANTKRIETRPATGK